MLSDFFNDASIVSFLIHSSGFHCWIIEADRGSEFGPRRVDFNSLSIA